MKVTVFCCLLLAGFCVPRPLFAASLAWNVTPGVADTEVSTTGTQVFGYYFNSNAARPPVETVNSVPFTLHSSATAPAGLNFNGSYNNPEDVDAYQVPLTAANAGLNQILDGQNWGGAAALTLGNLVPGQLYQLQYMIGDDRAAFLNVRNYDVSDGNDAEGLRDVERAYHSTRGAGLPGGAPAGSREGKIFTATFTADAATQDIWNWLYENTDHTGGNSGSQVNALQLRIIPEPGALVFGAVASFGLLAFRRRCA